MTNEGGHFRQLAEQSLAAHYRVLAPDLIGHGYSRYTPPWSIADQIEAILETVGTEPAAAYIGHSYGGRISFEIAAHYPELVKRLVLLDPAIRIPGELAAFAIENCQADRTFGSLDEAVERRYVESVLTRAPRSLVEEGIAEHLLERLDGRLEYRYSRTLEALVYAELATEPPPFTAVTAPTLLVLGEDSYLPYDDVLAAQRAGQGDALEAVTVPGGHTVLWDALPETTDAIVSFLART